MILIALAPVSLGLFAGAAWTLLAGVKHEPGNSGCAGLTGTRPTASCTGISADPGHHFRLTRTAFRAELNAGVAHPVAQYTRVQIRVLEQPPSLRSSVPRAIESALQNWFSTPYVADIRRDAAS